MIDDFSNQEARPFSTAPVKPPSLRGERKRICSQAQNLARRARENLLASLWKSEFYFTHIINNLQ